MNFLDKLLEEAYNSMDAVINVYALRQRCYAYCTYRYNRRLKVSRVRMIHLCQKFVKQKYDEGDLVRLKVIGTYWGYIRKCLIKAEVLATIELLILDVLAQEDRGAYSLYIVLNEKVRKSMKIDYCMIQLVLSNLRKEHKVVIDKFNEYHLPRV